MLHSRLARTLAVAASLCAAPALAEPPELGPLVSGTPAYLDGAFVWTDYAYDVPGGNATYPPDPYPTADLIQVQLGTGPGGELEVAIVLETLLPGADVAVGIGLNTDRSQVTGAAFVPGGQWTPLQPLGLEHMVVLSSAASTATLMTWQGAAWQTVGSSPATVDRASNVIRALVPALPPGTATWHVVGVAGWTDDLGSWAEVRTRSTTWRSCGPRTRPRRR